MIGRVNTGGGGTGGKLTVTTPGAGITVTVSKDGKTKTKVSGADGTAVFKGLEGGTWTITITDGIHTSTKPVVITADYSAVIAFFSATINVTYPAGSTCTATDGVTTLTAPDTSGTWACAVPNAGTWTVICTSGDNRAEETVNITANGQSKNISVKVVPGIYKPVEYIQTTGTQYINTGIVPSDNTYQVSTKIALTTTEQNTVVLGTNSNVSYHLTPFNGQWYFGTNGSELNAGTYNATIGTVYTIEFNNASNGISINGNSIVTGKTFTDNESIKVAYRGNTASPGKYKYYYFKIINNKTNKLLMDLVPCYRLSDSVAGMYDHVSGKFFTNAGTGTFLVGGEV